jgi:hypothetical protein
MGRAIKPTQGDCFHANKFVFVKLLFSAQFSIWHEFLGNAIKATTVINFFVYASPDVTLQNPIMKLEKK